MFFLLRSGRARGLERGGRVSGLATCVCPAGSERAACRAVARRRRLFQGMDDVRTGVSVPAAFCSPAGGAKCSRHGLRPARAPALQRRGVAAWVCAADARKSGSEGDKDEGGVARSDPAARKRPQPILYSKPVRKDNQSFLPRNGIRADKSNRASGKPRDKAEEMRLNHVSLNGAQPGAGTASSERVNNVNSGGQKVVPSGRDRPLDLRPEQRPDADILRKLARHTSQTRNPSAPAGSRTPAKSQPAGDDKREGRTSQSPRSGKEKEPQRLAASRPVRVLHRKYRVGSLAGQTDDENRRQATDGSERYSRGQRSQAQNFSSGQATAEASTKSGSYQRSSYGSNRTPYASNGFGSENDAGGKRSSDGDSVDEVDASTGWQFLRMLFKGETETAFALVRSGKYHPTENDLNEVLTALSRSRRLALALRVLSEARQWNLLPPSSVRLSSIMIDVYGKARRLDHALETYQGMLSRGISPNVVTYNTLIAACARSVNADIAFKIFKTMREKGVSPDKFTYGSLIDACSKAGLIHQAFRISQEMTREGVAKDQTVYSALIDACGRCGAVDRAFLVYEEMKRSGVFPNLVTFAVLIDCCGDSLQLDRAFEVFREIKHWGLTPNVISYTSLIDACSKSGHPERAELVLQDMLLNNISPNEVTFGALIDAWLRNGGTLQAINVLENMSDFRVTPALSTLLGLLRLTRAHGPSIDMMRVLRVMWQVRLWPPMREVPQILEDLATLAKTVFDEEVAADNAAATVAVASSSAQRHACLFETRTGDNEKVPPSSAAGAARLDSGEDENEEENMDADVSQRGTAQQRYSSLAIVRFGYALAELLHVVYSLRGKEVRDSLRSLRFVAHRVATRVQQPSLPLLIESLIRSMETHERKKGEWRNSQES
ncbi:Pentatricopeptide repeat-containing protein [Porphyridium purpureum]|uniref:Pentatricopeptide repeat-containing protein n=1 Tax=Porphyridium purpureum TaxID=35688 RepID=A0A5J4Z7B9_PORPP|nr:Pentatricopeptide repeat-containing protein [Porphyridium purpureum]|eukprot:POR6244..scf295_1